MSRRRLLAAAVCASVGVLPNAGCRLIRQHEDTISVAVLFDSAVGIYETGDVVVLDSPVGSIEAVELEGDHVRVQIRVRRDVPLPADVSAAIEAQTVLGERTITLFPSWNAEMQAAGAPRLEDGDVIPQARTVLPVEPDEALQSFNELVSSLDPDALGGLVHDGARILDGRGERIGESIDAAATLSDTLAAVDEPMLASARSLNQVASVLNQREAQLRSLIDDFGIAVGVLADERQQVEVLLSSLVGLTDQVRGIVDVYGEQLPATVATLVTALQVVEANADTIPVLVGTLPTVAESFVAAYKPEIGGFFLKVNTSAVAETVVVQLLDAVGLFPGAV